MINQTPEDPDIGTLEDSAALDKSARWQLNPIDKHFISLRWVAIGVAIATVIVAVIMEVYILLLFKDWNGNFNLVPVAIAPIASITVIVASILIGAFRKSANDERGESDIFRLARRSINGPSE